MSRIRLKRKEYKINDLKKYLISEMHGRYTQAQMAKAIGVSQPTFSNRLKDTSKFTFGDLLTMFELLGTSDEKIVGLMKT